MGRHSGSIQTGYEQSHATGTAVADRWTSEWSGVSAAALLELPVEAENVFVPIPGNAGFGAVRLVEPLTSPLERVNPNVCWWDEGDTLAELGWAVEEIFFDPTPTADLVRPFIGTENDPQARWADEAPVPPPTPVDGVSRRGLLAQVPTRRELRERRRRETSLRWITKRRLAKGGVLAVTAFGVVAYSAPHVAQLVRDSSVSQDAAGSAALTAAAPVGVAAGTAAGSQAAPTVSPDQDESRAQRATIQTALQRILIKENADAQVVGDAASKAAQTAASLAKAQADAAKRARAEATARAQRDAVRDPRALAEQMVADRGWSSSQFTCLNLLWNRESMWRINATNPSSGAYGIPQALPASKMASAGSDWRTNPATQIKWGLNYISQRYGTPCGAWAHSQATGWY